MPIWQELHNFMHDYEPDYNIFKREIALFSIEEDKSRNSVEENCSNYNNLNASKAMHKYEEASREILNKVDVPIKFQQGKHDDAMIYKLSHILYGYAH